MDFRNDINDYISLEIETLKKLDVDAINEALNLLIRDGTSLRIIILHSSKSNASADDSSEGIDPSDTTIERG